LAQTTTLSNTGNATLNISSIVITGTNPGDFPWNTSCGSTLVSGLACNTSVNFLPTANGPRSALLTITDNASGSPQTVSLSGTGTSGPIATLQQTSLAFTARNPWSTSAAQYANLYNTGNAPLTITSFTLGGANPQDFALTNTCAGVGSGSYCPIAVTFTPNAAGSRTALISISDNASNSPQTISLSGAGVALAPTLPGNYSVTVTANGFGRSVTIPVSVQ
jgi:hypothetical protein